MANVFDVAKYILNSTGPLSTMKLQKLCYYAQAWSLVWDDDELFSEEFEAWANGPVCNELYQKHKGKFKIGEPEINSEWLSENGLDENQIDTIDVVLETYGGKDAQWLSTLTHMEDPWQFARKGVPAGASCENIITKESMSIYYGAL